MESTTKKNLGMFLEEERRNIILPRGSTESSQLSSPRMSSASLASLLPFQQSVCPDTLWMHSSYQQPLYHCIASLQCNEGSIYCLTLANDLIFTGSSGNRIHAWKQPDCMAMGCINATTGQVHTILACGNMLVSSHNDFRIRAWDLSSSTDHLIRPKKAMTLPQRRRPFFNKSIDCHKDVISCLAFHNDDKLLYTGSWDHTVKVWSINNRHCMDSLAHNDRVNAVIVCQDDGRVFTCSSDGTVRIWRRVCKESSHILTITLKFQRSPVNALALSGYLLYSGSSNGLINFWEKENTSGRYNHGGFLQGHHFAVLCLVTIQNMVLSGSEDATVRIWRREVGSSLHSCLTVIDGHHGPVKCLAASLEGTGIVKGLLVYTASFDQTLKVWRVQVSPNEKVNTNTSSKPCKMSPVLSPSWVEMKIQGSDY